MQRPVVLVALIVVLGAAGCFLPTGSSGGTGPGDAGPGAPDGDDGEGEGGSRIPPDAGDGDRDAGDEPDGEPPGDDAAAGEPDADDVEPEPGPGPGDLLETFVFPEQHAESSPGWGAALTDVLRHLPASYGHYYRDSDPITSAHETTHGINAHLRNHFNDTGRLANAFYLMEDRAIVLVEPGIRKSAVAPYVPASLRGSRYDLYVVGMSAWDDRPLYIVDEWVAYTNGGAVGVDMVASGLWTRGWRDGVAGTLEFTVYSLALAMAVEEADPTYWATSLQFRELVAWLARRAMDVYRQGAAMPDFAWDRMATFERALRESPDAEPMRAFVRRTYGETWAREVLGLP